MSGKRVSFPPSPPRGSRSHKKDDSKRNSGTGSSSSGRASPEDSPDDSFTDPRYRDQHNDVQSLQTTLARERLRWEAKFRELTIEATNARKKLEETEARLRAELARNQELEDDVKHLHERCRNNDIEYNDLREQFRRLQQEYFNTTRPSDEPVMSGGSGEPMSIPIRRKSKHEKDDPGLKERMKKRMNGDYEGSSKVSSNRSDRRSSRAPSKTRKPYIEPMPPANPMSPTGARSLGSNYMTTPLDPPRMSTMEAPHYSHVKRTSHPSGVSPYGGTPEFPTGNYEPHILPDPRGRRR
jgi:hypothetical protein